MKLSPVFALAALGIATLGLTTPSGQAAPDQHTSAPRQVQIKVEWVTTAPATFGSPAFPHYHPPILPEIARPISTKSLTLTLTEDHKATGGLQQGAPSEEGEGISALAHINPDQTITIHLTLTRTGANDTRQTLTTIRTFKPGVRVVIGGMKNNAGQEEDFATVSLVKPSDER